MPRNIKDKLIIKKLSANEGTLRYTSVELKTGEYNIMRTGNQVYEYSQSGINVFDTRGHVFLNETEKAALDLMLDGRVKNLSIVKNRTHRYAHLLFEFWKSDSQLFPAEIMANNSEGTLSRTPHAIIFVFDGSLEEVPNGNEEVEFYRGILQKCRKRNYLYPKIVLTRVDKLEKKVDYLIWKRQLSLKDRERKIKELQDEKIESVVFKLGLPRKDVHFIENYHKKHTMNDIQIDYHALKLLKDTIDECERYVEINVPRGFDCRLV